MGFKENITLPVVLDFEQLKANTSDAFLNKFDDDRTNIIFVGRISPNKKQDFLIRSFYFYNKYLNPSSRLILVGSTHQVPQYYRMLKALAARLGLTDVHFLNSIDQAQLNAVYRSADLFFCASEHEGFCIPLLEAMHFDVPVVAFAAAAVPETLGGAGVMYQEMYPVRTAALIDAILSDNKLKQNSLEAQRRRLADFAAEIIENNFLEIINDFLRNTVKSETANTPDSSGIG